MFLNPIASPAPRPRTGRIGWTLLRRPAKSWDFPAEQERLVTAEDMTRYGVRL